MTKRLSLVVKLLCLSLTIGPLGLPLSHAIEAESFSIFLATGEQRWVQFPGLKRYSIGDSRVIRVRPDPENRDSLLIKGVKSGSTDLWIWKELDGQTLREAYPVRIESAGADRPPPALSQALSHLQNMKIYQAGKVWILRGTIQTSAQAALIQSLETQFPDLVQNETELSDELVFQGEAALRVWLATTEQAEILKLERRGQTLWLSGVVSSEKVRKDLIRQARHRFPSIHLDISSIEAEGGTVYFRVYLLEIAQSEVRKLGIDWPINQMQVFRLDLQGSLSLLSRNGHLQVLANPELVVRTPGEAQLFAGGEIPISEGGKLFSRVQWRPYGLKLQLAVKKWIDNKVRLDILTEFSHLDPTTGINDIPGIKINRMNTHVDARVGEPVLLCGLLQDKVTDEVQGLPILKDIPILGKLFGSQSFLSQKSELVAILIPSLTQPPHPMRRLGADFPGGSVPPPRNWISQAREADLKNDPEFPWNVFRK